MEKTIVKKNTNKLKPYEFNKTIEGYINVHLSIPFKSSVKARMEVYENENGEEYYGEDYEYGVDDILNHYSCNKNIKPDIELFKRLGWTIEEISAE